MRQDIEQFKVWLTERAAQVFEPTNEYELVRFKTPAGMNIIFCNKKGRISAYTGQAHEAWDAFIHKKPWTAGYRDEKHRNSFQKSAVYRQLERLYGELCCYCGVPARDTKQQKLTIEHYIPLMAGGPDHICNMGLACMPCNSEAGSRPVFEKIAFRDMIRERYPEGRKTYVAPQVQDSNPGGYESAGTVTGRYDSSVRHTGNGPREIEQQDLPGQVEQPTCV